VNVDRRRCIVAIAGGGFLFDEPQLMQERYLVSLCERTHPRALFLGTAGGDSERSQLKFIKAFSRLGCRADSLAFFPYDMRRDYADAVAQADLIYVGGGNTVAMLAVWREFGFERALRAAYDRGTVVAGISAGANCWFERYVTDSVPGGGVREGLGWLPGTFCPHLDSEPWRRPLVESLDDGPLAAGGEGVMARYDDETWHEAVTLPGPGLCLRRDSAGRPLQTIAPRALEGITTT
jgi:dipeptidase E